MRSPRRTRAALGALLTVVALSAAGCGDDQDPAVSGPSTTTTSEADGPTSTTSATGATTTSTTAEPADDVTVIEVTVTGGEPEGGARTASVDLGTEVELRVTADSADEVHVHGYDLTVDVEPGVAASLRFTADLPGRWEIELEEAGVELLQLEVRG